MYMTMAWRAWCISIADMAMYYSRQPCLQLVPMNLTTTRKTDALEQEMTSGKREKEKRKKTQRGTKTHLVQKPLLLGKDGPPQKPPRLRGPRGEQLRNPHAASNRLRKLGLVPARMDEGRQGLAAEHHLGEGADDVHDEGGGVLVDGVAVTQVGEVCRGHWAVVLLGEIG